MGGSDSEQDRDRPFLLFSAMWAGEGLGRRGLREPDCVQLLALLFVHFLSPSVCLRMDPRAAPRRGVRGRGQEGASTYQKREGGFLDSSGLQGRGGSSTNVLGRT